MLDGDKTIEPLKIRTIEGNFYMFMMQTITLVLFHQSPLVVEVEIAIE